MSKVMNSIITHAHYKQITLNGYIIESVSIFGATNVSIL